MNLKRFLIASFLIYCAFIANAQIPKLKPDTTAYYIERSPFYKEFAGKYDLVISHHHEGGWSMDEFYYTILAFKGKKRYKIVYSLRTNFSNDPPNKPQIKKELINKYTADSILSIFSSNNFWGLNNDTLAITKWGKYYDVDAHQYLDKEFYISDGISDVFETITRDGYQMIYSYEPEYYFHNLPQIKQRGRLLNAKRAFLSLFPNIWQPPTKQ
ncbi:hypothetical protein FO440_04725 [Mucilaginibacter corticis]|uniref:Uncharacterized protein n=1 Tax=Mucilaginibacter corticis TaxID=2597670 RepID=A0A556MUL2_9SPHI|nr:hypothetical protein [Mucilaginibacter corticis]TSJ43498.1 hypothetical protein FO440_04725 [Mucilaginibacter corticis]